MENNIKVFVYGSLKQGYGNHDYHLDNSDFLGKSETLPQYSLFSLGGFPGVIKGGVTAIQGELYAVNEEGLQRLDRLEGHPGFYQREVIETSEGEAWIYLLPEDKYKEYPIIDNGNW